MKKQNWYEIKRKNNLGFFFMRVLLFFPAVSMRVLCFPIGFFYWLFCAGARAQSKKFFVAAGKKPQTLRHIISFALNLAENIQAWAGKIRFDKIEWQNDDISIFVNEIDSNRGTLLLISHLGNAQMLKALAAAGESGTKRRMKITTIMDKAQSAGFNALQKSVNESADFHIVSADEIGAETVLLLEERLSAGEVFRFFRKTRIFRTAFFCLLRF